MNCSEVEISLTEIARGEDVNPAMRKHALLHAHSCSRCGVRLDGENGLSQLLDSLRVEMQIEAAPARLENVLRAEFRSLQEKPLPVPVVIPQRSYLSRWMLAAAVIILVFALGLLALKLGGSGRVTPLPVDRDLAGTDGDTHSSPNAGAGEQPKQVTAPVEGPKSPAPRIVPQRRRSKEVLGQNSEDRGTGSSTGKEIATEFFPIGGTGDLADVDSGHVVRVELPSTAMISYGIPVDPNRENQRVTADVVVGSDGIARAIRFVR